VNWEKNRCHYLILSVDPAARNLKHLSWGAASRNVQNVKAEICKSRCRFSRIGAVAILPHQVVRAAVQAVPVVPAQAAVHVISQARARIRVKLSARKQNEQNYQKRISRMRKHLKIGTRGSLLATTQSTWVKKQIETHHPGVSVELVIIVTKGDKILDVPLAMVGGKGLFVKEIEEALLRKDVDLAVHSMKDVPSELPEELHLGIIPLRENPHDAFISTRYKTLADLPQGATVGTSSLRRRAQLAALRPDLKIVDLRGNLDTRLRKLDEGQFQAIILAAAGLNRLGMSSRATGYFTAREMLPAVGQGALGIELRKDDAELLAGLAFLNDDKTTVAVAAERAFLHRLEGGCQVPIGAFAEVHNGKVELTGLVASIDGKEVLKDSLAGPIEEAKELGTQLANRLLDMGGREILAEVYGQT
jgi:hydroxymethylbilane synthase